MTESTVTNAKPIDVKTAVKIATKFVADLYDPKEIFDITLEEVEHGTDGYWYITVGFTRSVSLPTKLKGLYALAQQANPNVEREYKIVKVDEENGKPISMKIRQLL